MIENLKLKHEGDFVSTAMTLWTKGWFKYPEEADKKGFVANKKGYRSGRLAKFIFSILLVYIAKVAVFW